MAFDRLRAKQHDTAVAASTHRLRLPLFKKKKTVFLPRQEALLVWCDGGDGRLMAVLVYRVQTLVRAGIATGVPLQPPADKVEDQLSGGGNADEGTKSGRKKGGPKAKVGFLGRIVNEFEAGQKDVTSSVEQVRIKQQLSLFPVS